MGTSKASAKHKPRSSNVVPAAERKRIRTATHELGNKLVDVLGEDLAAGVAQFTETVVMSMLETVRSQPRMTARWGYRDLDEVDAEFRATKEAIRKIEAKRAAKKDLGGTKG